MSLPQVASPPGLLAAVLLVLQFLNLVAITIGAWLLYTQIKKDHDWNRRQATQQQLLRIVSGEFTELRQKLQVKHRVNLADPNETIDSALRRLDTDEARAQLTFTAEMLFNYFETIALGVKNNVFDKSICYDHFGYTLTRYYKWGESHIRLRRSVHPAIWIEWRSLAEKWQAQLRDDEAKLLRPGLPPT